MVRPVEVHEHGAFDAVISNAAVPKGREAKHALGRWTEVPGGSTDPDRRAARTAATVPRREQPPRLHRGHVNLEDPVDQLDQPL